MLWHHCHDEDAHGDGPHDHGPHGGHVHVTESHRDQVSASMILWLSLIHI